MKKFLISTLLLLAIAQVANAQIYYEEPEEDDGLTFWDKTYFGGNLSLSFGTITYIEVSPLMGYMVTPDFSVGAGATYMYFSRKYSNNYKVENSVYGGRTFLRYRVFENFYFHSEFESLNNEVPLMNGTGDFTREWVPGFYIGGGIFQPTFKRGGVSFFILYNLMYDEYKSPYSSAWVLRAGFTL